MMNRKNQWVRKLKAWNLRKYAEASKGASTSDNIPHRDLPAPPDIAHPESEVAARKTIPRPQDTSRPRPWSPSELPVTIDPTTSFAMIAYLVRPTRDCSYRPSPEEALDWDTILEEALGEAKSDECQLHEQGPTIAPSLCSSDFTRFRSAAVALGHNAMSVDELSSQMGTLSLIDEVAGNVLGELVPMDVIAESSREAFNDSYDPNSEVRSLAGPIQSQVRPMPAGAGVVIGVGAVFEQSAPVADRNSIEL